MALLVASIGGVAVGIVLVAILSGNHDQDIYEEGFEAGVALKEKDSKGGNNDSN